MYIEDALGDRIWVDLDSCKELVSNVCTLFATKPCSPAVTSASAKSSGESKGSSSESAESASSDAGELCKEVSLSGIETAPR